MRVVQIKPVRGAASVYGWPQVTMWSCTRHTCGQPQAVQHKCTFHSLRQPPLGRSVLLCTSLPPNGFHLNKVQTCFVTSRQLKLYICSMGSYFSSNLKLVFERLVVNFPCFNVDHKQVHFMLRRMLPPATEEWTSDNALDIVSGGVEFEAFPLHRLCWHVFHDHPQHLQANSRILPRLCPRLSPSKSFPIHQSSYNCTQCALPAYRDHIYPTERQW
jgi:hypothetical protein